MTRVEIHYQRPPDRLDVFVQDLVVDRADCKVTLHDPATLEAVFTVGEVVIYEPGAAIVWFVFPGAWHDIGRFHLEDGTFTGYYVNLITPVQINGPTWTVDRRWIDPATAERARSELSQLVARVSAGEWPPAVVREYDLPRVRGLRAAGA
jgi:predicted RNA-binding protein associated with RNAse of E/G family